MSHTPTLKTNVAAISIFASAGMAAAKFAVGIAIGSLALISEALHSSVDVVATVITWLVVRVSDQPADEEHHYGHGKFESLSALFVIALLYVLTGGGFSWGDSVAAIAVAVMISILGLRLGRSTIETLLDRAPEGVAEKAIAAIRAVPGVVGVERLRVRMVGPTHFIDAIAKVP